MVQILWEHNILSLMVNLCFPAGQHHIRKSWIGDNISKYWGGKTNTQILLFPLHLSFLCSVSFSILSTLSNWLNITLEWKMHVHNTWNMLANNYCTPRRSCPGCTHQYCDVKIYCQFTVQTNLPVYQVWHLHLAIYILYIHQDVCF